jgi:hypothetical protein
VNEHSQRLLRGLETYIRREIAQEDAVKGIAVVGSVAVGTAGQESDVDAIAFMSPVDLYAMPAECRWSPSTGAYASIFDDGAAADSIQLDFTRVDFGSWAAPGFAAPEGYRAELASSFIAFDRNGDVAPLVAAIAAYDDSLRTPRLDESLCRLDDALSWGDATSDWEALGPVIAHDRLQAAYEALVGGLFAYNSAWRPWRSRETRALLALSALPETMVRDPLSCVAAIGHGFNGYASRRASLEECFDWLSTMLRDDPSYGDDPVDAAFIRAHEEPGRAWNLADWVARHGDSERR